MLVQVNQKHIDRLAASGHDGRQLTEVVYRTDGTYTHEGGTTYTVLREVAGRDMFIERVEGESRRFVLGGEYDVLPFQLEDRVAFNSTRYGCSDNRKGLGTVAGVRIVGETVLYVVRQDKPVDANYNCFSYYAQELTASVPIYDNVDDALKATKGRYFTVTLNTEFTTGNPRPATVVATARLRRITERFVQLHDPNGVFWYRRKQAIMCRHQIDKIEIAGTVLFDRAFTN